MGGKDGNTGHQRSLPALETDSQGINALPRSKGLFGDEPPSRQTTRSAQAKDREREKGCETSDSVLDLATSYEGTARLAPVRRKAADSGTHIGGWSSRLRLRPDDGSSVRRSVADSASTASCGAACTLTPEEEYQERWSRVSTTSRTRCVKTSRGSGSRVLDAEVAIGDASCACPQFRVQE